MDSALAGELTETTLADVLATAATTQMIATYTGDLKRRIEPLLVHAFHRALKDGAADAILTSLRPTFDRHAQAVEEARTLIPNGSIDSFLASATPAAVKAWQQLDGHVSALDAIGRIASAFGPRIGVFPLVDEYALAENFRLDDRAYFCMAGDLETDSKLFRGPGTHRNSPWCRTVLKLHTVDEARDRYRQFASSEWERVNAGPTTRWVDEHGKMHEGPGRGTLMRQRNWHDDHQNATAAAQPAATAGQAADQACADANRGAWQAAA